MLLLCRNVGLSDVGFGGPIGFPAFSRISDQFCMLNRPAPGEHLGNQAIILILEGLVFSTFLLSILPCSTLNLTLIPESPRQNLVWWGRMR